MGNIIGCIILCIIAIACFVFSCLQFKEKGFLLNNAYIYASKQERETMDKKASLYSIRYCIFANRNYFLY